MGVHAGVFLRLRAVEALLDLVHLIAFGVLHRVGYFAACMVQLLAVVDM